MSGPRIGELFSGYGGLGAGVQAVLGGSIAWHSEIDPGACKILAHRYPDVPNHGDITAIDWTAVEPVDVLTGGFPCQDVSGAGLRKGLRPDTRSGLWTQFAYAIDQLRPGLVVIENVRGLLSANAQHAAHGDLESCDWCVGDGDRRPLRALGAVLGDLSAVGYDASWQLLRASDVGAPHARARVFIVAWPAADARRLRGGSRRLAVAGEASSGRPFGEFAGRRGAPVADADDARPQGRQSAERRDMPARCADSDAPVVGRRPTGWDDGVRAEGLVARYGHWGDYEPAIRRWERVTRPAPAPTEPNKNGQPRLSPAFVEWLMGLPAGWVTDVPGLTRNEQLKALGNGVVVQQCAEALRLLLPDIESVAA